MRSSYLAHPQLGARLAAHSLSIQLGKHMLSIASNERVPMADQHHTEPNAPFMNDRGPKRGMYNQIAEKSGGCGGEWYVRIYVCMYVCGTISPVSWYSVCMWCKFIHDHT